jgi:hypothetical protein
VPRLKVPLQLKTYFRQSSASKLNFWQTVASICAFAFKLRYQNAGHFSDLAAMSCFLSRQTNTSSRGCAGGFLVSTVFCCHAFDFHAVRQIKSLHLRGHYETVFE